MKDLTKIYIDLSKCTEEERKEIARIINKHGHSITSKANYEIINGCYDKLFPLLTYYEYWYCSRYASGKQELTYPEFIKLFEGGEGETQVEHTCKYCGCLTTQPDSECYAAPKNKMETLFEKLKYKIKKCESAGDDMNDESWNYQVGVLITGNDAKEILEHTAQIQADKAELLEALEKSNIAMMHCDWSENEGSPHLLPIYKSNESLIQKMKP